MQFPLFYGYSIQILLAVHLLTVFCHKDTHVIICQSCIRGNRQHVAPIIGAIAGFLQKFSFGGGQDFLRDTVDTLDTSGTEFSSYLPDPLPELSDTDIVIILSHRNNDGIVFARITIIGTGYFSVWHFVSTFPEIDPFVTHNMLTVYFLPRKILRSFHVVYFPSISWQSLVSIHVKSSSRSFHIFIIPDPKRPR